MMPPQSQSRPRRRARARFAGRARARRSRDRPIALSKTKLIRINEATRLVQKSGVAGHESEVMTSPASPERWRGFSRPVQACASMASNLAAARGRIGRIR